MNIPLYNPELGIDQLLTHAAPDDERCLYTTPDLLRKYNACGDGLNQLYTAIFGENWDEILEFSATFPEIRDLQIPISLIRTTNNFADAAWSSFTITPKPKELQYKFAAEILQLLYDSGYAHFINERWIETLSDGQRVLGVVANEFYNKYLMQEAQTNPDYSACYVIYNCLCLNPAVYSLVELYMRRIAKQSPSGYGQEQSHIEQQLESIFKSIYYKKEKKGNKPC